MFRPRLRAKGPPPPSTPTLSLHGALPILAAEENDDRVARREAARAERAERAEARSQRAEPRAERERPTVVEAIRERVMESRAPRDVQVEPARDRPAMREIVRERVMERRGPRVVEVDSDRPTPEQRREVVEPRVREHRGPRMIEVDSLQVVEPRVHRGSRAIEARESPDSVRNWRRAERRGG